MMIHRFLSSILVVVVSASIASAQSTVTLPSLSLDLDGTPEVAAAPNCLRTPDHRECGNAQVSGRTFSLSDVVNLGIIDRSEIEADAGQGEEVAIEAAVDPLPSVDIEIVFDYASADLRQDQLPSLVALADDMREIDFTRARLVVMGHTDGVGSRAYNQQLSQRRAASVAAFLSRSANVPLTRISASGMAFDFLLFPEDPDHPGNRRVQVLLVE